MKNLSLSDTILAISYIYKNNKRFHRLKYAIIRENIILHGGYQYIYNPKLLNEYNSNLINFLLTIKHYCDTIVSKILIIGSKVNYTNINQLFKNNLSPFTPFESFEFNDIIIGKTTSNNYIKCPLYLEILELFHNTTYDNIIGK